MQLSSTSAQARVASFLKDAEQSGLLADVASKIEAKRDLERKRLAAELKQVPADRDKTMPSLAKAVRAAGSRLMSLQDQLAAEWRLYWEATSVRDSADYGFDKRAYALRRQLAEVAPEILSHASIRLERMADLLRDRVYFRALPGYDSGGRIKLQHESNLAMIEPILAQIKDGRALIEEMVYAPVDYATIEKNCEAILGDVRQKVAATLLLTIGQVNELLGDAVELSQPIRSEWAPPDSESLAPRAAQVGAA